jgi:hypothetical protein
VGDTRPGGLSPGGRTRGENGIGAPVMEFGPGVEAPPSMTERLGTDGSFGSAYVLSIHTSHVTGPISAGVDVSPSVQCSVLGHQ